MVSAHARVECPTPVPIPIRNTGIDMYGIVYQTDTSIMYRDRYQNWGVGT